MKKRLDVLVYEKGLSRSRNSALALIKEGRVTVDSIVVNIGSKKFDDNSVIEVLGKQIPYVGRGGLKLEKALLEFNVDPTGLIALDIGASTGGFTECLLRHGAKKIYAVDVGTNQLNSELKNDRRVISMEQTDIRDIKTLPDDPDLAVIDVSFISLELVLPHASRLINKTGKIIALVKPQFETTPKTKNRKGVVINEKDQIFALEKIANFCDRNGLKVEIKTDSPILGGSGNKEYFLLLKKTTR